MGFFSRLFGKDTIKMVDVKDEPTKEPFIAEEDRTQKCIPKKEGENDATASPFLDKCDE